MGAGVPRHPSHGLRFPIRRVVVLVPPSASQAARISRLRLHFGRQGQPVQRPRFMPLRKAQAFARQLQVRHIGQVAVL